MLDISIIILNWNGQKWLKDCLNSLREQVFKNFEIILADNASSDGSVEFTRQFFPTVKIIQNSQNLGYAQANNEAAQESQGRYLLFLNNDTKLDNKCLEETMKYVAQTGSCISVLNILDYHANVLNSLDEYSRMGIDMFGYPLPSKKIFYADGAALLIEKRLFFKLDGFDERHFMCAEDIDLSWRAQLLGFEIGFIKSAVVYHEKGGTMGGSSQRGQRHVTSIKRRYLTERNSLRNLIKNYSGFMLVIILPLYLILFIIEMLFFLLRGDIKIAKDIYWQTLTYNIVMLGDTLKMRRAIQSQRIVSDWQILKRITLNKFYKWEVFKKMGVPVIK